MVCYLLMAFLLSASTASMENYLRKLIGSNCVRVETGIIPPHYECLGCVIERAQACVDDMRYNKSGNVFPSCDLHVLFDYHNANNCCPKIQANQNGRLDLMYVGSAYPEAIRCIEHVGCKDSILYAQLVDECLSLCPEDEFQDQKGNAACFANFNSALHIQYSFHLLLICILFLFTLFLSL